MAELPSLHDPVTYIVTGPKDQRGPYTLDLICNELLAGRLSNEMLIWWPGMTDWVKVQDHEALQAELQRRRGVETAPPPPQGEPVVDHALSDPTASAPGWASPQSQPQPEPQQSASPSWSAADLPVAESSPDTIVDARVIDEAPSAVHSAAPVGPFGGPAADGADIHESEAVPPSDVVEAEIVDDEPAEPQVSTDAADASAGDSVEPDAQVVDAEIVEDPSPGSEFVPVDLVAPAVETTDDAVSLAVADLISSTEDLYRRREHRNVFHAERRAAVSDAASSLGWRLTHDESTAIIEELEFENDDAQRLTVALELLPPRAIVGNEDFSFTAILSAPRNGTDPATNGDQHVAPLTSQPAYGDIVTNVDEWTGTQTHTLNLILGLESYVNIDSGSGSINVDTAALKTDIGHVISHLQQRCSASAS